MLCTGKLSLYRSKSIVITKRVVFYHCYRQHQTVCNHTVPLLETTIKTQLRTRLRIKPQHVIRAAGTLSGTRRSRLGILTRTAVRQPVTSADIRPDMPFGRYINKIFMRIPSQKRDDNPSEFEEQCSDSRYNYNDSFITRIQYFSGMRSDRHATGTTHIQSVHFIWRREFIDRKANHTVSAAIIKNRMFGIAYYGKRSRRLNRHFAQAAMNSRRIHACNPHSRQPHPFIFQQKIEIGFQEAGGHRTSVKYTIICPTPTIQNRHQNIMI